jgi:hypothetical protein
MSSALFTVASLAGSSADQYVVQHARRMSSRNASVPVRRRMRPGAERLDRQRKLTGCQPRYPGPGRPLTCWVGARLAIDDGSAGLVGTGHQGGEVVGRMKDGGIGGPQLQMPRAPSKSSGFQTWSSGIWSRSE